MNNKINDTNFAGIFDARNDSNNPICLLYSEIFDSVILNGSMAHGRSQPGFNLANCTPFVHAAKKALDFGIEREEMIEVIAASLEEYYELVRPKNAAEWLGIPDQASSKLLESPPWAAVFPWRARTMESYRLAYENAALKENAVLGNRTGIEAGWLFCGPVVREKCMVEAKRIGYVLKEIATHGYMRSNDPEGDVKATALLKSNGDWRWLITAGNHRAAASAALGFGVIPIRVNLVIMREHVEYWPRVADQLYTKSQALQIFDNFFDGQASQITKPWIERVSINLREK